MGLGLGWRLAGRQLACGCKAGSTEPPPERLPQHEGKPPHRRPTCCYRGRRRRRVAVRGLQPRARELEGRCAVHGGSTGQGACRQRCCGARLLLLQLLQEVVVQGQVDADHRDGHHERHIGAPPQHPHPLPRRNLAQAVEGSAVQRRRQRGGAGAGGAAGRGAAHGCRRRLHAEALAGSKGPLPAGAGAWWRARLSSGRRVGRDQPKRARQQAPLHPPLTPAAYPTGPASSCRAQRHPEPGCASAGSQQRGQARRLQQRRRRRAMCSGDLEATTSACLPHAHRRTRTP